MWGDFFPHFYANYQINYSTQTSNFICFDLLVINCNLSETAAETGTNIKTEQDRPEAEWASCCPCCLLTQSTHISAAVGFRTTLSLHHRGLLFLFSFEANWLTTFTYGAVEMALKLSCTECIPIVSFVGLEHLLNSAETHQLWNYGARAVADISV